METALSVAMALKYAIRKAVANHARGKNFSRKSPLKMEALIRLLIGALVEMLKRNTFSQKALIIGGRGFERYNLIAHCLEKPNVAS